MAHHSALCSVPCARCFDVQDRVGSIGYRGLRWQADSRTHGVACGNVSGTRMGHVLGLPPFKRRTWITAALPNSICDHSRAHASLARKPCLDIVRICRTSPPGTSRAWRDIWFESAKCGLTSYGRVISHPTRLNFYRNSLALIASATLTGLILRSAIE
jgi:hypothetical protein